ncbi:MAG: hypothetical protein ACRD0G_03285 [Acidimicrobiales bacterium]
MSAVAESATLAPLDARPLSGSSAAGAEVVGDVGTVGGVVVSVGASGSAPAAEPVGDAWVVVVSSGTVSVLRLSGGTSSPLSGRTATRRTVAATATTPSKIARAGDRMCIKSDIVVGRPSKVVDTHGRGAPAATSVA